MAKIPKSIRVDAKVYNYIERYKGEGFNEKFENIILDAMESEKKRIENVKTLDKEIETLRKKMFELHETLKKRRAIVDKLDNIFILCDQLEKQLD